MNRYIIAAITAAIIPIISALSAYVVIQYIAFIVTSIR